MILSFISVGEEYSNYSLCDLLHNHFLRIYHNMICYVIKYTVCMFYRQRRIKCISYSERNKSCQDTG